MRRVPPPEDYGEMACTLHVGHCHQCYIVTDMQAVGSRVIADIKGYLFLSQELAELFGVGALLEKATFSQYIVYVCHRDILLFGIYYCRYRNSTIQPLFIQGKAGQNITCFVTTLYAPQNRQHSTTPNGYYMREITHPCREVKGAWARPAQMIKKYAAGVDINAADILWTLLCALLSSCGTGSFAPLGPAAICAGMLTGMGSRAFLGAVIGGAAACRWAGLAHSLVFAALCLIWGGPMRKRRRDKPVLLISAGVLIAPIFYIDSLDAAMTGLGQLSASLFFSAVFYRAAVALNRAHLGRGIGERDMTALFLTAGACCAAAAPYCMRGVSLGGILAAFTALILSGSVGIYAVACAAVAGAGAAIGGGSVAFAGAVVIGALSASALRKGKKMGVCCGFLGVCLVCAYFGDCELTHGIEATIAAILYVMIPNKKLKQLADLFEMQEQEAERRLDSLKSRVKETAEVLDRVSSLFEASPESELELFAGRQLRCMSEAMVNIPDEGERRYTLFCGTAVRPKQGVRRRGQHSHPRYRQGEADNTIGRHGQRPGSPP